jgi:hypothetical protein
MAQFKGDLNNDGRITMIDVPLLLKASAGQFSDKVTVNGVVFRRGDVNDDGSTSLVDVPLILDHINGVNLIDGVIYGA